MFRGQEVSAQEFAWNSRVLSPESLSDDASLEALITGQAGVIVLRGFLSKEVLSSAFGSVEKMEPLIKDNLYPNTRLITVGPYLAGALDLPQAYFDRARDMEQAVPPEMTVFTAKIYDLVATALCLNTLNVAREESGDAYSPFMVLIHRSGMAMPLHNDMIARDAIGSSLRVAAARSQLRCTVCLQECTSGGELILYKKQWSLADEASKIRGNFGYPLSVVEGCKQLVFKPETGDIYIFNPTYYHEVAETAGDTRVTLGFFFGRAGGDDRDMVAWS